MVNYLTRTDEDNFGPEILDVVVRGAMHAVAPHLQNLQHQNDELHQQLVRETKRNLDAALDREIPNWREVNSDSRFWDWLTGIHDFSGVPRQQLLNGAVASGDADRVIRIFRGFIAEVGGQPGRAAPRQAAPGQSRGMQPSGRIYGRDEILKMAARRRRGEINDQAWLRWEHELIAAARQGRIRGALDADGCQMGPR
jgi:hypothetical protein